MTVAPEKALTIGKGLLGSIAFLPFMRGQVLTSIGEYKKSRPDHESTFPTPARLADGLGLESSPAACGGFTPLDGSPAR